MSPKNLFSDLPVTGGAEESFEDLLTRPGVRIERIVSHGHASAPDFWYDQDEDEWVLVLRGAARLEFAGGPEADSDSTVELGPGDHCFIPAHRRHRVAWTTTEGPTIWLAIFLASNERSTEAQTHSAQRP